jgi:lipopolysaccharide export system ATP-binding protein
LVKTDSGQVILNNHKIDHLPMHKRAKLGLGYLPQEPSVFRKLSVEEMLTTINKSLLKKETVILTPTRNADHYQQVITKERNSNSNTYKKC